MEYARLEPSEQNYGKKVLLESQISLLQMVKKYQKFKELRALEIKLKNVFRRQLTEIQAQLEGLEKSLPKAHLNISEFEKAKMLSKTKSRYDLEAEIDEIRRKLAQLG